MAVMTVMPLFSYGLLRGYSSLDQSAHSGAPDCPAIAWLLPGCLLAMIPSIAHRIMHP